LPKYKNGKVCSQDLDLSSHKKQSIILIFKKKNSTREYLDKLITPKDLLRVSRRENFLLSKKPNGRC
jgi:hypothetical protein